MKVIVLNRDRESSVDDDFDIVVMPDSSITLQGRPIVVPDTGYELAMAVAPAFRIGRLGKDIPERFASRHIDGVSTCAIIVAAADVDSCRRALLAMADGAITHGEWSEWNPSEPLRIDYDNRSVELPAAEVAIEKIVERLSRLTTLKNGDIIVPLIVDRIELPQRGRLEMSLGGAASLSKRVI